MESPISIKDIGLVAPIIVVFLCSLIPLSAKLIRGNKEQAPLATLAQAILGIGLAVFFIAFQNPEANVSAFLGSLSFNGTTKSTSLVLCLIATLCLFLSKENINTLGKQFSEHVFLVLCSLIGMFIMVWANDLIVVFIGLEIMSLAAYILIALSHEQKLAKEAAFKYFILGSVASAIFLYGVALLYGAVGSTYFDQVTQIAISLDKENMIFVVGSFLVVAGMLFKVSIFPFHAWTPDVYQGAPTPITAFMSTGVKIASFIVLLKVIGTGLLKDIPSMYTFLEILAVFTIIFGNIAALIQKNVKRMIAYSSIAHSGYILIGVIVSGIGEDGNTGLSSTLFYMFTYAIVSIGLLSIISLMENSEESFISVEDFKGLSQKAPVMSFFISILLLSLAGIPPLAGFFGKLFIFGSAVDLELYWLVFWGVIGSVISIFYYLRPMVMMYMHEETSNQENLQTKFLSVFNVVVSVVSVLLLGIYSGRFFEYLLTHSKELF